MKLGIEIDAEVDAEVPAEDAYTRASEYALYHVTFSVNERRIAKLALAGEACYDPTRTLLQTIPVNAFCKVLGFCICSTEQKSEALGKHMLQALFDELNEKACQYADENCTIADNFEDALVRVKASASAGAVFQCEKWITPPVLKTMLLDILDAYIKNSSSRTLVLPGEVIPGWEELESAGKQYCILERQNFWMMNDEIEELINILTLDDLEPQAVTVLYANKSIFGRACAARDVGIVIDNNFVKEQLHYEFNTADE